MTTATRSCASCGSELPISARFCRTCGAPQAEPSATQEAAIEEPAAQEPRPTFAGRSHFPVGRVLLVLAVGGVIAYFAISGGSESGSESDTNKANRLARTYSSFYRFGHDECSSRSLADLRFQLGTTVDADRSEIALALQKLVQDRVSGDPFEQHDKGFTAAVGCFDAWGGLAGRDTQPLNEPPGGSG